MAAGGFTVGARSAGVLLGVVIFGWWWSPWKALGAFDARSFVLLASGGLLASVVGQMAFYQALKGSHESWATPIAGAYPLVAALLGWMVLREPLTLSRALGVACIVCGVWLLRR